MNLVIEVFDYLFYIVFNSNWNFENFKIKRGNSSNGGGLYIYNSVVLAKNLDLSNNISSSSGGAINLIESS